MSRFVEEIKIVPGEDSTEDALRTWLTSQMSPARPYMLAFADDGVIWGKLVNGGLVTSHDVETKAFQKENEKWVSAELRAKALRQAFIFGGNDEIRLFRDEMENWKALSVKDADEWFPESQILWGDEDADDEQPALPAFLRIKDNHKGIPEQFVPMVGNLDKDHCLRLEVHHIVEFNEITGEASIAISRLAGLSVGERSKEVER